MDKYLISIDKALTSYVFYNEILPKLHDYYLNEGAKRQLVFDFSLVKSIDPLVIPNLLCIGFIIKETSECTPKIYIPNSIHCSSLKRYINEINFIKLAEDYELYEFDASIKGGWINSQMDKLNTTFFFYIDKSEFSNKNLSACRELIDRDVSTKFNKFYNKFLSLYNNYFTQKNSLMELSKELIENSILHGNSFSFVTIQYNYKKEKVYLSFSDCGKGFHDSFMDKLKKDDINEDLKKKILNNNNNEIEAIILGILHRNKQSFGLYDVIKKVLTKKGIVRIHSNNSQLVLTSKNLVNLELANDECSFLSSLINDDSSYNIRKNLKFQGTHIEIELPITKGELFYE